MSKFDMIRAALTRNRNDFTKHSVNAPRVYRCLVNEVHKDMRADIYVPAKSAIYMGVHIMFPSVGRSQGSIIAPQEHFEGIYMESTDGMQFVLGGISFSKNFFPHQILPGENETYCKGAFQKMDKSRSLIHATNMTTDVSNESGERSTFYNEHSAHTPYMDTLESTMHVDGVDRHFFYGIYYTDIQRDLVSAEGSTQELMRATNKKVNRAETFMAALQNYQFSDVTMEEIQKEYLFPRRVSKIVEKGLVFYQTFDHPARAKASAALIVPNALERERIFGKEGEAVYERTLWENGDEIVHKQGNLS